MLDRTGRLERQDAAAGERNFGLGMAALLATGFFAVLMFAIYPDALDKIRSFGNSGTDRVDDEPSFAEALSSEPSQTETTIISAPVVTVPDFPNKKEVRSVAYVPAPMSSFAPGFVINRNNSVPAFSAATGPLQSFKAQAPVRSWAPVLWRLQIAR